MKSKTSDLQSFLNDLRNLRLIFFRRWPFAVLAFTLVTGLVGAYTYVKGVTYESSGKILLEREKSTASLVETEIGELTAIGGNDPMATEVEIVRSIPIVQQVVNVMDLRDDDGVLLKPENLVKKRLKIEKVRGTDLLKISFTSDSPDEAADFVNRLMAIYLQNAIVADRQKANELRQFVSQQLPQMALAVRQAEESLRRFQEANKLVNADTEAKLLTEGLDEIQRKSSATRIELNKAQARYATLQQQSGFTAEQAVTVDALSQSPGVSDVAEALQVAEKQLLLARNHYEELHPKVLDLKEQVAKLGALLDTRAAQVSGVQRSVTAVQTQVKGVRQDLLSELVKIQAIKVELERQSRSLEAERQHYEQKLQNLPRLQKTQRELQRRIEAAQATYATLLKKQQEIQVTANQQGSNGRIIEYAKASDKFLLKPIALKIILGILLGGMAAIGVVLLLELRDQSVKTVQEAKTLFNSTLLGVIPLVEKGGSSALLCSNIDPHDLRSPVNMLPHYPVGEAYRMLQSNLRFMHTDLRLKTLVVTSSIAGEGKSTTVANLATSMAQQGHRVLIIDADLRHPTQHLIWESSNLAGLSDLIIDSVDLRIAIKKELDNLHVLTAGAIPPEPSALLDSERMSALVERFAQTYDYVLIDTPPLLATSESRSLCKMADGVILTVRPRVLRRSSAIAAKELLEQINLAILGIVANGVTLKDEPHSYFHYDDKYYYRSPVSMQEKRPQPKKHTQTV
ncbi:polysaccharide biosynthesis tyrosine autokinase [Acaryochloris sp. IP29b_bin.137]|uniref:GumC family protein n=1 Tax=Acaryochloris sp. IP29b_bin.137 TaxID=2969217 RepID=UPI002615B44A|nr:polysaccharide biosynthesis tyrosine autokinase [Acaryochloris sp. IP29b_bin.137]